VTIVFGQQVLMTGPPQFADALLIANMREWRKMHEQDMKAKDK